MASEHDLEYWAQRHAAMEARWDAIQPTLATKADVEKLRTEMHEMSVNTHKWMTATMIGLFIGFGGLYLGTHTSAPPAAAAGQPIVIVIPASALAQPAKP